MNPDLQISVIIPAYNAQNYIARAINSVLKQTLPPAEIIVIDDGSTDNTTQQAQTFGKKIKYLYKENGGVASARNLGIKIAQYNWIAFLDADDQWLETKLQRQTEILKRNPQLNWVAANFIKCLCNENRKQPAIPENQAKKALDGKDYFQDFFPAQINPTYAWTGTILTKKQCLTDAGPFRKQASPAEDIDLWWRIAFDNPQIGYCPTPLAIYHMDIPQSISQGPLPCDQFIELIEHNLNLAHTKNQQDRFTPLAAHMAQSWIRAMLFENRPHEIKKLTKTFNQFLNPRFKLLIRALLICPGITAKICHAISKIVRTFGLRKHIIRRPQ